MRSWYCISPLYVKGTLDGYFVIMLRRYELEKMAKTEPMCLKKKVICNTTSIIWVHGAVRRYD